MSVAIQLHADGTLTLFDGDLSPEEVPLQLDLDSTDQRLVAGAVEVAQLLRAEHGSEEFGLYCEHLEVDADDDALIIRQTRVEGMSGRDGEIRIPWVQFGAFLRLLATQQAMHQDDE